MKIAIAAFLLCLSCAAQIPPHVMDDLLLAVPRVAAAPGLTNVTAGLVAWWTMDDASGSTVTNSIPGVGDGIVNSGSWGPGKIAGGVVLSGSGFIQFTDNSGTDYSTAAMTLSIWVKFSSLANSYNSVISRVAALGYYQLLVKSDGTLAVYLSPSGGFVNYDGTGANTLTTGTWYQLVVTYDSSSGLNAYVNNALDKSVAANGTLGGNSNRLDAGDDNNSPGRNVSGTLDDFRYYNRVLNATELNQLYQWSGQP